MTRNLRGSEMRANYLTLRLTLRVLVMMLTGAALIAMAAYSGAH